MNVQVGKFYRLKPVKGDPRYGVAQIIDVCGEEVETEVFFSNGEWEVEVFLPLSAFEVEVPETEAYVS